MFFRRKLAAATFFDNYSNEVAQGGDTIHIPIISSNFTAATVTSTSGDCAIMNVNDTSTTIVLSTWQNANHAITDLQKAQIATQYRLKEGYAIAMGHALATKLDTDLLALATNLDPVVGDSATDIQATTLEEAINIMESYSVPLDECLFIFHPNAYWGEVIRSRKLTDMSWYGKATLPTGAHDMLYGIPVVISPNVPAGTADSEGGHRNLLVQKSAFVFAIANLEGGEPSGVRLSEKKAEALRTKIIADIAYGVQYTSAYKGVRIISNT